MGRKGITWLRRRLGRRLVGLVDQDAGMTTVEYAICTLGAAGIAGLMYAVMTSDRVLAALTQIIERALTVNF